MQVRAYLFMTIIKNNFLTCSNNNLTLLSPFNVWPHTADARFRCSEVMGCNAMQSLNSILHPVSKMIYIRNKLLETVDKCKCPSAPEAILSMEKHHIRT